MNNIIIIYETNNNKLNNINNNLNNNIANLNKLNNNNKLTICTIIKDIIYFIVLNMIQIRYIIYGFSVIR
jgi:hypothetical protein